jgi:hypothetical protein
VVIFHFVDDFLMCGEAKDLVRKVVAEDSEVATTTEPISDPESLLGHDVVWDRSLGRVALSMEKKINQLVQQYGGGGKNLVKRIIPVRFLRV